MNHSMCLHRGEKKYEHSCDGLYADYSDETEPCELHYIPYYCFANRGEDDMTVWVRRA